MRAVVPAFRPAEFSCHCFPEREDELDARIRILIVEDHAVVRTALALSLEAEPDFEVIGEAVDGLEAIERVEQLNPDVVLMDITMPRMNGIDATRRISASGSPAKVVGLSMHDNDTMGRTMLTAGATAYVSKSAPLDQLVNTVRQTYGNR